MAGTVYGGKASSNLEKLEHLEDEGKRICDYRKLHEINCSLNELVTDKYFLSFQQIIRRSLEKKFNDSVKSKNLAMPVFRLGKEPATCEKTGLPLTQDQRLVVVDRKVIEGIRAVKRMMEEYISSNDKKPLSIAVFGPPGDGKSLAVRKIIEELHSERKPIQEIKCNLSELTSRDDLYQTIEQIQTADNQRKFPVVFFDEFDSEYDRTPLGWLRYFLAPMEEGKYKDRNIPRSIFVFAGGTSSTFKDFAAKASKDIEDEDLQAAAFKKAKAPDFISRLRGHLDVVGINPDPENENDKSYLIRRAVVIRALLANHQNLRDGQMADIDEEMLHAFLTIENYKHGARSVRMLLEMCTGRDRKISMSAVPPKHQLDMQVDGLKFYEHILSSANRDSSADIGS